jgi:hypothetical protein
MEWLKSQLARWKVQVSFVAGALVVATAYGTCIFEPPVVEVSETTTIGNTEATTNTVEVSATAATTSENTGNTNETTTATETTTE